MGKKKNKPSTLSSSRKKIKPLSPELSQKMQQAFAMHQKGMSKEAQQLYLTVVNQRPDYADANYLLGVLLFSQGFKNQALPYLKSAATALPNEARYVSALGVCFLHIGDHEAAIQHLDRVIKLAPKDIDSIYSLGTAYLKQSNFTKALEYFQLVLKRQPGHVGATNNMGMVYAGLCQLDISTRYYEEAFKLDPQLLESASNAVFNYNYLENLSPKEVYKKHIEIGKAFPPEESAPEKLTQVKPKIRVGYVSADYRIHSVAYFLLPLLQNHNKEEFEVYCYYNGDRVDEMTKKFQAVADQWVATSSMSDKQFTQTVREHKVDILVDLAGHSGYNRLAAFSRRAAPVQITWLGYPHSTGVPAMDFRIIDEITDPSSSAPALNSETLIHLPNGFLCYDGEADITPSSELPYTSNGYITFGSFNNLLKVNEGVVQTWANILSRVENARLVIKSKQLSEPCVREHYANLFEQAGVSSDRVELRGYAPNPASHLAQYNEIDIALDTFPYNGTTTTCEALWMGVPTVTFTGTRHAERVGASIMTHSNNSDLIAKDLEGYQSLAVELASKPERLKKMREGLRESMKKSDLCNAPLFAKNIEEAYKKALGKMKN